MTDVPGAATGGTTAGAAVLAGLLDKRLVIVTGKGGVGKTTISAALARVAAAAGRKVLVAEIAPEEGQPGPLHGLIAGSARVPTIEPAPLAPGIDGVLITPFSGQRAFLHDVLPLGFLADRALKAELVKRFFAAAPAFAELGVLYRGLALVRAEKRGKPQWDLLIIDAPATGHALAFASLPEVALRIFPGGPIGRALKAGHELLTDKSRTAVVVATLPEALPVAEALELVAGLEKSRLHVAGVVANQVPGDPFSAEERAALATWLGRVAEARDDVLGRRSVERLDRAASALDRLRKSAGDALLVVGESAHRGAALLEKVASELDRAGRPAAPAPGAA